MSQKSFLFFSSAALALVVMAGCAHHRDVRAGADGVHRVVVKTDDEAKGTRDAINQANHFCEQRGLSAAFVNEQKKYEGSMDQKDYENAKAASRAAKTVGGAAYVFGGKRESGAGGLVTLGGVAADAALGEAYRVEMTFKCL